MDCEACDKEGVHDIFGEYDDGPNRTWHIVALCYKCWRDDTKWCNCCSKELRTHYFHIFDPQSLKDDRMRICDWCMRTFCKQCVLIDYPNHIDDNVILCTNCVGVMGTDENPSEK